MEDFKPVPPVAIIGVGNLLMSDEGIGIHVIRAMGRCRLPHRIELIDGGTGGLSLLNLMRGRERVIIVDAVSAKAPPGAVYRWTPTLVHSPPKCFRSAHTEDIQEILQAGSRLFPLPSILCIGIIPHDAATPGTSLSRTLRRQLPAIARIVRREGIQRSPSSVRSTSGPRIPRTRSGILRRGPNAT